MPGATIAVVAVLLVSSLEQDSVYIEGKRLYAELEYEMAVEKFQQLLSQGQYEPMQTSSLYRWLGLCRAGLGQLDSARTCFQLALALDPEATLPVKSSPKIAALYQSLRNQSLQQRSPPGQIPSEATTQRSSSSESASSTPAVDRVPTATAKSPLTFYAALAAAAGGVAALAGAVCTGFTVAELSSALDRSQYQDQAQLSLDSANGFVAVASVTYVLSAALFAASGVMLGMDVFAEGDTPAEDGI